MEITRYFSHLRTRYGVSIKTKIAAKNEIRSAQKWRRKMKIRFLSKLGNCVFGAAADHSCWMSRPIAAPLNCDNNYTTHSPLAAGQLCCVCIIFFVDLWRCCPNTCHAIRVFVSIYEEIVVKKISENRFVILPFWCRLEARNQLGENDAGPFTQKNIGTFH